MNFHTKYIIFENKGLIIPILFPEFMQHSKMSQMMLVPVVSLFSRKRSGNVVGSQPV